MSNSWTAAGNMAAQRHIHTATLLGDGRVLFAAGRSAGAYFNSAELFVLPPLPAAPTIGSATAGNASATVSFTPAYHIGLTPLSVFTAASSPGGFTGSCAAPCSSIQVTGLVNATPYTFTVVATNSNGNSAPSAASNSVTPSGSATALTLYTSGTPNAAGTNVTFTAIVAPTSATGAVAFTADAVSLAGCNAVAVSGVGTAVCNAVFTTVGTRTIAASYSGDTTHQPASTTLAGGQAVIAPSITITPELAAGAVGLNYGPVQVLATGGVAPHSFAATGSLPTGLQLTSAGVLSGIPSVAGSYDFALVATDANGFSGSRSYTVEIVPLTYAVTPSAGANGSISPSTLQTVVSGATTSFTISPNAGYSASVAGTCGGTLVGATYTTNAITANCAVTASFALNNYSVTPSAGTNGTISPSTVVSVNHGATTSFTITPNAGYSASVGGTCGGTLVGATYTTNAITANCAVTASFALNSYSVTPSAGTNGTISPSTVVSVNHGATTSFTITPNAGYSASVGGTCDGTLVGSTYTTNAITANCAVTASFTLTATMPGAPQITDVTALDAAARITFSAPNSNGGSSILDYTASCTPGPISNTQNTLTIDVTGLSNNLAYRCSVRARNAVGLSAPSAELSVIPGASGTSADLSISKTNRSSYIYGDGFVDYTIVVSNPGATAVTGARVQDPIALGFQGAAWICTGLNNAYCPSSGSGALDIQVDLPAASSVQIIFSALPVAGDENPLSNTASVSAPVGISDPLSSNNSATDGPDVRGIFRGGFE